MATRREKVILDLEDNFTTGMARAAASAQLLDSALNDLSGSSVASSRAMRDMNRSDGLPALDRNASSAGATIDRLSGRMRILAEVGAMLGPALAPLGAAAVPGLTALTAQAGAAASALGVTVLALQGVGDGLKALNAYQLEPTAANLAKVTEEFERLGPSGAAFVTYLDSIEPQLESLQRAARNGALPGFEEGIDGMLERLPQLRGLISELSTTVGDLAADAGRALGGEEWDNFFSFLDERGAPILTEFSQTVGNFALGFANMLAAFDPASQMFSGGLADMARSFRDWSESLDSNATFQEFLAYLEQAGPMAQDFLGSLVDALTGIATAAAPVGDVVLPILTKVLDVLAGIADSDIGTPIIAGLAALSAYNRVLAVTAATQARMQAGGGLAGFMGTRAASGTSALKAVRADVAALGATWATAGARSVREQERMAASAKSLRSNLGGLAKEAGRVAGPIAGLALVTSGAADNMGLSNTASLALMGTLAGPWGAAVGGSIGLAMDFASANDSMAAAVREADEAMASGSAEAMRQRRDDLAALVEAENEARAVLSPAGFFDPSSWGERLKGQGKAVTSIFNEITGATDESRAKLEELDRAIANGPQGFDALAASMHGYAASINDSGIGRTVAVSDAIAALDDKMLSTAQSASALASALDALFSPALNRSEAADQWISALRTLDEDLNKNNKTLEGNSNAALENREAIRSRVGDLLNVLKTEADAGASSEELSRKLKNQRQALLDAGAAAGLSRNELRGYLNELGMTPEMVETILRANTGDAKGRIRDVQRDLDKYGLTIATGKAALNDVASGKIRTVQGLVDKYGMTKAEARALLRDLASGALAAVQARLNGLDGDIATVTVRTVNETINKVSNQVSSFFNGKGSADGSTVPKTGLPYADRHPYLLADGEEVISNRHGQADRWRPLLKAINYGRLAGGGTAGSAGFAFSGWAAGNSRATTASAADLIDQLHKSARGLKGLTRAAEKSEKIIDKERQKRQDLVSQRDEISGRVTDSLRSDIWETSGNAWSGAAADPLSALRADIAKAGEHDKLRKQLTAKGLDGNALEEALSEIDRARLLGGMTRAEVNEYERLYNRRERLTSAAGAASGVAVMGPELREQTRELRQANKRLDRLERAVKVADKNAKRNSDKNASDVTKGVNGAGTKGKRSQRRDR